MEKMAYTLRDVCEATNIGMTRVYAAINKGQLKARKYGKKTLILKRDLEDFLLSLEEYN